MTFVNEDQAEFWASMAPTWVELEKRMETVAEAPGLLAMDRLQLEPGHHVVDLGCGTGPTTVELARRVGPDGHVVGVDIAAEMLARGRQRAADQGLTNVEFVHADVQAHDLGEARFDRAFSRYGVMFYSDPVAAFGNIRRSLRPGGRLGFACWQNVFANEWMLVPGAAVMGVTGTPPPMPAADEPGPFSLSDPDRVRQILGDAGFTNIEVTPSDDFVVLDEAEIPEVAGVSVRVGAAREALKDADDATKQKALDAVLAAMRERVVDGQLRFTRGVLLVTASA